MLGTWVRVRIEVPRGGHVKRRPTGKIELVSPIGCPFAYGSIHGVQGADCDLADAIVLGPRRRAGEDVVVKVHGVIHFVDRGRPDDKWVCGEVPTSRERQWLATFFRIYALAKRARSPWARSGVSGTEWLEVGVPPG